MGDYCLGQHLGGQFWEVVWTLRDPSGFKPWLSIAAVVTIHHFNDFSSFTGPLSLFLHSCLRSPTELTIYVTSMSWTLLLRETNLIHFFFCWRGGERMGVSDLQEEISQQGSFLSQETTALFLSVDVTCSSSASSPCRCPEFVGPLTLLCIGVQHGVWVGCPYFKSHSASQIW